jgi:hypothetical protein
MAGKSKTDRLTIAIDGPSGAGKSTTLVSVNKDGTASGNPQSKLNITIVSTGNGAPVAGTSYSQLQVSGAVTVGTPTVGMSFCSSCHASQTADWMNSRHANVEPLGDLYSAGNPTIGQIAAAGGRNQPRTRVAVPGPARYKSFSRSPIRSLLTASEEGPAHAPLVILCPRKGKRHDGHVALMGDGAG